MALFTLLCKRRGGRGWHDRYIDMFGVRKSSACISTVVTDVLCMVPFVFSLRTPFAGGRSTDCACVSRWWFWVADSTRGTAVDTLLRVHLYDDLLFVGLAFMGCLISVRCLLLLRSLFLVKLVVLLSIRFEYTRCVLCVVCLVQHKIQEREAIYTKYIHIQGAELDSTRK